MTKPEMTQDYEAIYLAPKCMASGEREWCEHDAPYDCDCDDGPHPWIKFVRSDIAEAAEQRGMERERQRCLREAEDADPLGKDAFGMREYIAQAIRQGEQA